MEKGGLVDINDFSFLPEILRIDPAEPWWLLLASFSPILLVFCLIFGQWRPTRYYRSPAVMVASVPRAKNLATHFVTALFLIAILPLSWVGSKPVLKVERAEEQALIVWVYDASKSMSQVDVEAQGQDIARLDASVLALKNSLPTVPDDFYKMLVSFSDPEAVNVGIPTRSSEAILSEVDSIELGVGTATDVGLRSAVAACRQFFANENESVDQTYPCVIFLLSDGECTPAGRCQRPAVEIAKQAREAGGTIHTIALGQTTSDYPSDPEAMEAIAKAGGGQSLSTDSLDSLSELYNDAIVNVRISRQNVYVDQTLVWAARATVVVMALGVWILCVCRGGWSPVRRQPKPK